MYPFVPFELTVLVAKVYKSEIIEIIEIIEIYKSNSSSLYTFQAIWLAEVKLLHFDKVQSKNPSALFSFRCLIRLVFFGNICNILLTNLEF